MHTAGDNSGFEGKGWKCDVCGATIHKAEDGLVQWVQVPGTVKSLELRLVHTAAKIAPELTARCWLDTANVLETYLLTDLLGPTGLHELFEFAANGELPLDEILEMVTRLHTPEYEDQRLEHIISEDMF